MHGKGFEVTTNNTILREGRGTRTPREQAYLRDLLVADGIWVGRDTYKILTAYLGPSLTDGGLTDA